MFGNKAAPGRKKSRKKKVIVISLAGVLAAGSVAGVLFYRQNFTDKIPADTQKVQSVTVENGSIANTIVGTGNLTLADAQAQTIPSGLEIEKVLVESGDNVTKGDTIATVSKASVLEAIEDTQDEIQELDKEISQWQDSDDTDTITTSVSGRVKEIYAGKGDDVTDVMLEHNALLLLSLDGKMAVDIEASELNQGDSVTVTLSSGTEVTGTVETASDTGCTITITDNGTAYNDEVTVTDSTGTKLGTGTLYIHEPLEVTGTTGTISTVNVSENESVTSGTELFTLKAGTDDTHYQQLLAKREARSSTLKKLLQLSKNQKITAAISGRVQSVNVSAGSSDSSSADTSSSSRTSGSASMSQMSYSVSSEKAASSAAASSSMASRTVQTGFLKLSSETVVTTDTETQEEAVFAAEAEDFTDEGSDDSETALTLKITAEGQTTRDALSIVPPVTGNSPSGEIAAADGSYTGKINWDPADGSFQADTVYQATVTLYAGAGYVFTSNSLTGTDTGVLSGVTLSDDGSTLSFVITYPATAGSSDSDKNSDDSSKDNQGNKDSDGNSNGSPNTDGSDNSKADKENTPEATDNTNNTSDNTRSGNASQETSSNGSAGGSGTQGSAGNTANTQAASGSTTEKTESDSSASSDSDNLSSSAYSTDVEAFTISPDDSMVLSISVDELDINSVETGQEAVVELDAIEDETFTGEVTSVDDTASASGGVAKYTVNLTVPKDERMKQGMNASATITIDSRKNVLTIPVNALQEEGSKVFVYTEQDDEGNLSGEKEVTTGLSDGTTVEITDGLEEGETVYYNKTGAVKDSTSQSEGFSGKDFDGGNGGPGGDMPSDMGGTHGGNGNPGGGSGQGGPDSRPGM